MRGQMNTHLHFQMKLGRIMDLELLRQLHGAITIVQFFKKNPTQVHLLILVMYLHQDGMLHII